VVVGLAHRPSPQQRATDLRGLLHAVTYDIDGCAGDLSRSLAALATVDGGQRAEARTAISLAGAGAADCSPANDELIDDLETYEVPESLARFRLQGAVTGLIDWADPDAAAVQTDIAAVLAARGTPARAADQARLNAALATLDAQRAAVRRALAPAIRALAPGAAGPGLPG
jgi:hypothetical protein